MLALTTTQSLHLVPNGIWLSRTQTSSWQPTTRWVFSSITKQTLKLSGKRVSHKREITYRNQIRTKKCSVVSMVTLQLTYTTVQPAVLLEIHTLQRAMVCTPSKAIASNIRDRRTTSSVSAKTTLVVAVPWISVTLRRVTRASPEPTIERWLARQASLKSTQIRRPKLSLPSIRVAMRRTPWTLKLWDLCITTKRTSTTTC